MNRIKKGMVSGCIALSFAAFSMVAAAQEHHGDSCKGQANPQECMHAQMEKFRAEHEAKLHDALKLTPAQEPAWKNFTDSLHQQMATMEAEHKSAPPNRADMEKMSLPDRIDQHLAMEQKRLAMMQAHVATLKTFYAVLTPEQKVTMDKEVKRFIHTHHHGGWHPWHHGDHDGGMRDSMH